METENVHRVRFGCGTGFTEFFIDDMKLKRVMNFDTKYIGDRYHQVTVTFIARMGEGDSASPSFSIGGNNEPV